MNNVGLIVALWQVCQRREKNSFRGAFSGFSIETENHVVETLLFATRNQELLLFCVSASCKFSSSFNIVFNYGTIAATSTFATFRRLYASTLMKRSKLKSLFSLSERVHHLWPKDLLNFLFLRKDNQIRKVSAEHFHGGDFYIPWWDRKRTKHGTAVWFQF